MSLEAQRNSLDGLPEDVKKEYKQQGDVFVLDVTPVDGLALENVDTYKTKINEQNGILKDAFQTRDAAKAKLAKFDGIDPNNIATIIEEHTALKKIDPTKDAEKMAEEKARVLFVEKEGKLNEKHKAERDTLQKQLNGVTGQLEKNLVDTNLSQEIIKQKGTVEMVLPAIRPFVAMKFDEQTGTYKSVVIDGEGKERLSNEAGNNGAMQISELVREYSENSIWGAAFEGSGEYGSGDKQKQQHRSKSVKFITQAEAASGQHNEELSAGTVQIRG